MEKALEHWAKDRARLIYDQARPDEGWIGLSARDAFARCCPGIVDTVEAAKLEDHRTWGALKLLISEVRRMAHPAPLSPGIMNEQRMDFELRRAVYFPQRENTFDDLLAGLGDGPPLTPPKDKAVVELVNELEGLSFDEDLEQTQAEKEGLDISLDTRVTLGRRGGNLG